MKAVVIRQHGGPEALLFEERDKPVLQAHEVLIQVKAVALNHLDLWVRKGVPGHPYPLPLVPGCDFSGVVAAAGASVTHVKPGDPVVAAPGLSCGLCERCLKGEDHLCRYYGILGETRDGGCAEFAVVPRENALPKPAALNYEQAAAVPLVFLTAWHMLVTRGGVRPGEDVLIHAAGSGVSSAGIQIAKLFGAKVITTVGSAAKAEKAKALGADHVLLYKEQDVPAEIRALTGKRGVDLIMDHVGTDTWAGNLKSLAKGGRLVFCGNTSGFEAVTDLRFIFFKGLSVLGSTMGSKGELVEVWRHVERGRLKPVVDRTFPLAEIAKAHEYLESRQAFGKVVLLP